MTNKMVLELRPSTVQDIRDLYNLGDQRRLDEAIDIFEAWVKKQNHFLKKSFPRKYLENLILANKGSIEQAKSKLDKLCTLRTILPQFYKFSDIRKDFKRFCSCASLVILPKLTEDHYRVVSLKITANEYFHATPFIEYYILFLIYCEYLKMYDCSRGSIFIVDYRDVGVMNILSKLDPIELKQLATLILEGYGMSIQGIHIITPSKTVETLLTIVKPLFSTKIADRFRVHNSVESLQDVVSKSVLPVEYGGSERSLKDIQQDWINILSSQETMEYLNETREALVDNTYRDKSKFNEGLNMQGTFRSLNVD